MILVVMGLTACSLQEQALPSGSENETETPTSTTMSVYLAPVQTLPPTIVLEYTPTKVPTTTQTSTPAPPTETNQPSADVELTPTTCLETFCPPPWLDQVSKILLDQPGVLDAMALDELVVRIVYNPEVLNEEDVIELFSQVTGLEVEP